MIENKIQDSILRLQKGDLTAMEIEAIVFYANPDLVLGSGFGSAISARGGMAIQDELKEHGTISTGEAVVSSAGALKSKYIVHAVGPRFQEDDSEEKLHTTIQNALKVAKEKGIQNIAFPPMGTGFFGISLEMCAQVMLEEIKKHLSDNSSFKEVVICVLDEREYKAFQVNWND